MSSFALRVKSKSGHHIINNLQPESTIKELKSELASLTHITVHSLQVLSGFPPKLFDITNENQTLTASGLTSGETLIIEERAENKQEQDPKMRASSSELLQAINEQENCQGILIKHVVPADNSCLFSSLFFVLNRKIDDSGEAVKWFRELVAETISKDTETYSEAILGKPVTEYCSWIKEPTSWGGAIELSVLANHYGIEIAVVDTMNGIINRFGEDQKYPVRVYLMFDGIHYDPLYMESFKDGDIKTMFQSEDEATLKHAEQLAREAKSSRQFTDVDNFTLKCLVCGILLRGQVEAQQHAKGTGHANFGEV
ncbi:ubiquitin thioesterase OTU1 [Coccinella septempunctata]|uniref:ubiquitin thioesterase OTU1 n=1 Tax=Coccinella septempunctata TaxID=41139 RepID=UPI001D064899|nr:ubiquitin thioesterase OTU1 [Coccinella septempunctata]